MLHRDMAELVPELVSQLAPVALAHIDDDPANAGVIEMKPYRGRPRGMIINMKAVRLPIGHQLYARKAYLARVL